MKQVMYYEKRLKEMPLRVLDKHEIIKREGNLVSLNVKKLTFEQRRDGDTPNPKGGIRGVIPDKMSY